jgi:hypothetical protein
MKTIFNVMLNNIIASLNLGNQNSLEGNLLELKNVGMTIDFNTIHQLLGYVMELS